MIIPNEILFQEVEDRLSRGESTTILLVGSSMHPALINRRHWVTLSPLTSPLKPGEVYLFCLQDRHILHRLISIKNGICRFRGDNCLTSEYVPVSQVSAHLTAVKLRTHTLSTTSRTWKIRSCFSRLRGTFKRLLLCPFTAPHRRILRPWYFLFLLLLMWLPLNGLASVLPNYILGLRPDHFVHASVFVPCTWFLIDFFRKRNFPAFLLLLFSALPVALLTEGVQYLLPYRGFDINDLLANLIGIFLGWLLLLLRKLRR